MGPSLCRRSCERSTNKSFNAKTSERLGTVRSWGRSSCCWCGTARASAMWRANVPKPRMLMSSSSTSEMRMCRCPRSGGTRLLRWDGGCPSCRPSAVRSRCGVLPTPGLGRLRLREPERGEGPRHRPHGVGGQYLGHPFGPGGRRGRVDAGLLQRPAAPHRARRPAHRAPCGARCRPPLSRSPPPCKRLTAPVSHRGPGPAAPRRSRHPLRR